MGAHRTLKNTYLHQSLEHICDLVDISSDSDNEEAILNRGTHFIYIEIPLHSKMCLCAYCTSFGCLCFTVQNDKCDIRKLVLKFICRRRERFSVLTLNLGLRRVHTSMICDIKTTFSHGQVWYTYLTLWHTVTKNDKVSHRTSACLSSVKQIRKLKKVSCMTEIIWSMKRHLWTYLDMIDSSML